MGIEPTRATPPKLENTGFGVAPNPKCDWRVNFRVTWGNVRIRETTPRLLMLLAALPASRTVGCSIRRLSTAPQPSVSASQGPWPSSAPMSPVATAERSMYAPCPTSVAREASAFWLRLRRRIFPATPRAPCERVQRSPSSRPGSRDRPSRDYACASYRFTSRLLALRRLITCAFWARGVNTIICNRPPLRPSAWNRRSP